MGKLLRGFGMGLVLGSASLDWGQDPFAIQSYERTQGQSGTQFLESSSQSGPIIAQRERPYSAKPAKIRAQNAHVRAKRTAAQEYIYKREVFYAQERTRRIEERKRRGESLLRPSTPEDQYWFEAYAYPVWQPASRS